MRSHCLSVPLETKAKKYVYKLIYHENYADFISCWVNIISSVLEMNIVAPVISGSVLSGHSVLSSRLPKSRVCFSLITVIFASIKRSPLLCGRVTLRWVQTAFFSYLSPVLNGQLKPNHSNKTKNNLSSNFWTMFFPKIKLYVVFLSEILNIKWRKVALFIVFL